MLKKAPTLTDIFMAVVRFLKGLW